MNLLACVDVFSQNSFMLVMRQYKIVLEDYFRITGHTHTHVSIAINSLKYNWVVRACSLRALHISPSLAIESWQIVLSLNISAGKSCANYIA